MFSLQLFGAPSLEGPDGPVTGRATQRRRLALLAVLALARSRGVTRDRLIGLLWPEADTERARHLLSDSVYLLRKALGETAVLAVGDDLRLNPEVIRSDVEEFEEALERGDTARAVALHHGPFMEGFYPEDAPELERWIDGERERLSRSYARALEALAVAADERADLAESVERWRALNVYDPYCSRYALGLMRALDASGDRAAALQHARVHAVLLKEEFDAEPDPEVVSLAERLRSEPAPPPPLPPALDEQPEAPPIFIPEPAAATSAVAATLPERHIPIPGASLRPRLTVGRLVGVALVFALALSAVWSVWQRRADPAGEESPVRIAVLPFTVSGGSEFAYLGEGMMDLLSTNLDGAGTLRSVGPRALLGFLRRAGESAGTEHGSAVAAHFGAGLYILGSVVAQPGGRLRIAASLYDRSSGAEAVGKATVEGNASHLFPLVDQLTSRLIAALPERSTPRINRIAAITSTSLPAVRAFLEGERQFRMAVDEQSFLSAVEFFQRAVAEDSSFALAHYRLSVAAAWLNRMDLSRQAAHQAFLGRERLSERDARLVEAWQATLRGAMDEAENGYRTVLAQHPEDEEAWFQLGELLLRSNPLRARPIAEARAAYQKALSIQTGNGCARCSLLYIEMVSGNLRVADSLVRGFDPPSPAVSLAMRAVQAAASRDQSEQARILDELRRSSDYFVLESVFGLTANRADLEYAVKVAALLTDPERPADSRALGHIWVAYLEMARGKFRAAEAQLRAAEKYAPAWALEQRALLGTLPFRTLDAERVRALRDELEVWNAHTVAPSANFVLSGHNEVHPQLRLYLLGLLSARLGEREVALRYAGELERPVESTESALLARVLAGSVRAHAARGRGDAEGTLSLLERSASEAPFRQSWFSPFYAQVNERYLRGELLSESGRREEALRWQRSFGEVILWDLPYLAPTHLQQAEILERKGAREDAAHHYARVLDLWRDSDPEFRPLLVRAETRLQALRGRADRQEPRR